MTDPTEGRQPTEEELRAYLEQLRSADVTGIIAQVYEMLGTAAEVKLGRPDARTLIDTLNAVVDAAAGSLPEELAQRMREGISRLQTAQVQAESQPPEEPQQQGEQPADRPQQAPAGDQAGRMTDRLWIPGRGQPPG